MKTAELPLRDIHLPAEPSFWPLAIGWWILLLVAVVVMVWLGYRSWLRWQKSRHLHSLFEQLEAILDPYQSQSDKTPLLQELSLFLRRFEKFDQGQDQAAALSGEQWIKHLNSRHQDQPFTPFASLLTNDIYLPKADFEVRDLVKVIKKHLQRAVYGKPKQEGDDV